MLLVVIIGLFVKVNFTLLKDTTNHTRGVTYCGQKTTYQMNHIFTCYTVYMLDKNTLGAKNSEANQKQQLSDYHRQGKICWAKYSQFQCHPSFHENTFALSWP